ncbi:MAG: hypothetical protein LUG45_02315 [Clostridiales bacterium]|nr:hypothetical protein [Clostridiales bacterium]
MKQVKSKQRVADHGEVFTAEREVNAMLDLVKPETERIDSRFLEPACGDGNFLVEILRRKLAVVKSKYRKSPADYEQNAVLAVTSIYGVDILQDNVEACRERLFQIWDKEYTANCKKEASDTCREAVRYILRRNILCGNALTMVKVDEAGQDTEAPIVFAEWAFVTGPLLKRSDYRLDVLLKENPEPEMYAFQTSLFGSDAEATENWMIDPVTKEWLPKPIREYPAIHYRRVQEYGE